MAGARLRISVVIPTLNESVALERALESVQGVGIERIVVDGGSVDGTPERALRLGAERVLRAPPGRASQLAAGHAAALGDVLLFLHADSWLERGWAVALERALEASDVAGGAFTLRFESERARYRFIEWGARLRARFGGLPYGDQALFIRRKLLDAAGGIRPVPIFEDLDLARLIRRSGRLALLPERAWTSPRRYEANGPLRTWLRNSWALAGYLLGVDRDRLERWYRRKAAR